MTVADIFIMFIGGLAGLLLAYGVALLFLD